MPVQQRKSWCNGLRNSETYQVSTLKTEEEKKTAKPRDCTRSPGTIASFNPTFNPSWIDFQIRKAGSPWAR